MSAEQAKATSAAKTVEEVNFMDAVFGATKQSEPSRVKDLVETLVKEATKGTLTWDKNVTRTINKAIALIDAAVSKQLAAVMHNARFQKLEGSWRGLNYLVMNTETSATLQLKVMNATKRELYKDLDTAVEFDQSNMFKKIYTEEFGTPGGVPFGALIGDYEFTNHPDDISMLEKISGTAAAAFCPFVAAADPKLFGFESFTELQTPRDLEKIFLTQEYIKWRAFRDSEDSRFVSLAMPRVLARLPYGAATKPIEEFEYEEGPIEANGKPGPMRHQDYTWMSAAWAMGANLTRAFALTGFCTAIRGKDTTDVENIGGGKVEGLPAHVFVSMDGDLDLKCPTEIGISDRRENELSKLGFLPLCHYKNTDFAVFFGGQSTQKPKKYDRDAATANAAICARTPYIMAVSRFSHYLKIMARDNIGNFKEAGDMQRWLERWIANYVTVEKNPSASIKARYPLAEAAVEVKEIPGKPGEYNAVFHLRPWLQLEALTASMRMVARIPKLNK